MFKEVPIYNQDGSCPTTLQAPSTRPRTITFPDADGVVQLAGQTPSPVITSFTPVFSGLILGDGQQGGIWWNVGGKISVEVYFIAAGNSLIINPLALGTNHSGAFIDHLNGSIYAPCGDGYFYDSSTGKQYPVICQVIEGSQSIFFLTPTVDGSKIVNMSIDNSTPFILGDGDIFRVRYTYTSYDA